MTARRLALALAAFLVAGSPALADSVIHVTDPWARATIPARPGAAYLEIHNTGDSADRLIGALSARAATVELHQAAEKDGVMTMTPIAAVDIPAGGTANLAPGGLHLMLFGLEPPLAEGEHFPLTLIFESTGEITVEVAVTGMAGMGGTQGHGQGHGHGTTGN